MPPQPDFRHVRSGILSLVDKDPFEAIRVYSRDQIDQPAFNPNSFEAA